LFVVLPTDAPAAFAVPGDPGCVVVSAGMLRALDVDERRVLLAHEQAHLDRGHHRYLWVADMATAAVPLLRPLRSRVRFATERWADEEAVSAVDDRRLVARTLCRAALAQDAYLGPAMALAEFGVPARVEALLAESPTRTVLDRIGLMGTTAMTVLAGALASSVQLHHLVALATHLCPGS
jgi:beta-lactamase regulating signal transducer with metallopeptidase domain